MLRAAALPGAGARVWFTAADRGAIDWEHARLRGDHNLENALAAAAAAARRESARPAIDAALRAFRRRRRTGSSRSPRPAASSG